MYQRDIFLEGEGLAWLERNSGKIGQKGQDAVTELVRGIKPGSVLEIGCADGWRLRKLRAEGLCESAVGVEPSSPGRVDDGILLLRGTADSLPVHPGRFDCVIFGFCLYLCDPSEYFKIVCEADRVLADGGWLIVHDFRHGPYETPHRVPYEHKQGVYSHHCDFSQFWKAHPAYRQNWTYIYSYSGCKIPKDEMITLFQKDMRNAFNAQS